MTPGSVPIFACLGAFSVEWPDAVTISKRAVICVMTREISVLSVSSCIMQCITCLLQWMITLLRL
jgi:hypothetical protein